MQNKCHSALSAIHYKKIGICSVFSKIKKSTFIGIGLISVIDYTSASITLNLQTIGCPSVCQWPTLKFKCCHVKGLFWENNCLHWTHTVQCHVLTNYTRKLKHIPIMVRYIFGNSGPQGALCVCLFNNDYWMSRSMSEGLSMDVIPPDCSAKGPLRVCWTV